MSPANIHSLFYIIQPGKQEAWNERREKENLEGDPAAERSLARDDGVAGVKRAALYVLPREPHRPSILRKLANEMLSVSIISNLDTL